MKRRILSMVIAGILVMTSAIPVFATPNEEVIETQQKYEEINKKIEDIQGKIYGLNEQISPLIEKVENNKKQIESIKDEIENTNKEIETSKVDISEKEDVLGKRLRELYKSGGQASYVTLLFSADSFGDLISKIDSATRLVGIDKKIVKELLDNKEKLDEKVVSLEAKVNEITEINEENNKTLVEFEGKKKEQEDLVAEAKAEQAKFDEEYLAVAERSLVEYQLGIIASSTSSSEVQRAVDQLISIRDNQLKSPTVIEEVTNSIRSGAERAEELKAQEVESLSAPSSAGSSSSDSSYIPNRGQVSATGNAIVDFAYQYIGAEYVWGAEGPTVFDCSGFTKFVYANAAGIDITRTTYTQINVGTPVSYGDLQPGDLVFTYGNDHVGIYVGGGQYIHAPQPGEGVKVSPVTSFYAARRVIN